MTGFLAAGFTLNFAGLTGGSLELDAIANMGMMLMLFTIGLKLELRSPSKPEIWAGTTIYTMLSILSFGGVIIAAGTLGLAAFAGLAIQQAALIGFALSFSSKIFAVKTLEEKGEMNSVQTGVAIGVLIMQDIIAVLFITFSKGEFPSIWAIGLPLFLFAMRPIQNSGAGSSSKISGL